MSGQGLCFQRLLFQNETKRSESLNDALIMLGNLDALRNNIFVPARPPLKGKYRLSKWLPKGSVLCKHSLQVLISVEAESRGECFCEQPWEKG